MSEPTSSARRQQGLLHGETPPCRLEQATQSQQPGCLNQHLILHKLGRWHWVSPVTTLGLFGQLRVLAATEEAQKPTLVSSSSKHFPYDCLRTCVRAQFSLTHSFMKFSTYLPFCTPGAEAVPSPIFSFAGRLKTVCFCLLHEDLSVFFSGSSLSADSSVLAWTWQLTASLFWICGHCRTVPFLNKIASGDHRDPLANSSSLSVLP